MKKFIDTLNAIARKYNIAASVIAAAALEMLAAKLGVNAPTPASDATPAIAASTEYTAVGIKALFTTLDNAISNGDAATAKAAYETIKTTLAPKRGIDMIDAVIKTVDDTYDDFRSTNAAPKIPATPATPAVETPSPATPAVETPSPATPAPEIPATPPTPATPTPKKPATPSTPSTKKSAPAEKFYGFTTLELSYSIAKAIAEKIAELDKKVSITFGGNCVVIKNGGKSGVKIPFYNRAIDATEAEILTNSSHKWWKLTPSQIYALTEKDAMTGCIVDTANFFYTKAAQYLGLIRRPPSVSSANCTSDADKGASLPGFDEKYPTNNAVPCNANDDTSNPNKRAKYMWVSVLDWQTAFNTIQAIAPAQYSVKVYGGSRILYAADNGYGFEILTTNGSDAIVGKSMLNGNQIKQVTFGRVENGLLHVAASTEKILIFVKSTRSNTTTKQELLDWFGLPANDTFAPAKLGAPIELAVLTRKPVKEHKDYRHSPRFEFRNRKCFSCSFTDAAKDFFKNDGKILADSQLHFHTSTGVVKYIITESFNDEGLAMVPADDTGKLVNPNGGEPFIEGVEHVDFYPERIDSDCDILDKDLPVFARQGSLTKITLIPAVKSARRA